MTVHTIKEMGDAEQKERLIESLERGNRQSVTMNVQGVARKLYIEAAPRYKSLNVYNEVGMRMKPEELSVKQAAGQSVKQDDKKQDQKQSSDDGGEAEPSQKKSKRKKQSIS